MEAKTWISERGKYLNSLIKYIKSLVTTEILNLTNQADYATMFEKPLIELSCWDMPPT